jgi:hypothetical protein
MMGLADRVEAWARRFGIPPPPGVDGEERTDPDATPGPAPPADETRPAGGGDDDERFRRELQRSR